MRLVLGDVILWAMPTPLWSLLYSTIVLYDTGGALLTAEDGQLGKQVAELGR